MKSNSRAYNRDVSKRKALRKRRITQEVYWGGKDHPYYDNLHQYSKNKIHCSYIIPPSIQFLSIEQH